MPRKKKISARVPQDRRALTKSLQTPKGVHDILFPESVYFERLRENAKEWAEAYGYQLVELPVFEFQELFKKGIGRGTDVVEKEMYVFKTKGGDELALRPEATAGAVRSFIQNGMLNWPQPIRLWYWGPMFRHENPQSGRYRQFWQVGYEYFNVADPIVDAEMIKMGLDILRSCGLNGVAVDVNSIGCWSCREDYKKALKAYYRSKTRKLCPDCKNRFSKNILRLLDCKNEVCQPYKAETPNILGYLCKDCHSHFKKVLEYLENLEIDYVLNPFLVRGLDYYSRTVFEFTAETSGVEGLAAAPLALGGGGRYDYLVKILGGPDVSACGFALGVERIVELLKTNETLRPEEKTDLYLVQIGDAAKVKTLQLADKLKKSHLRFGFDLGRDSLKAQLRSADRLKAKFSIIIGEKEVFDENFILRDMESGIQETFPLAKAIEVIKQKIQR